MKDAQEKLIDVKGNPVQGPKEKQGKDEVHAKLSFLDLGIQRAKEISANDDRTFGVQNTIRADLVTIIETPEEAWASYTDGFKAVLDKRTEAGKPTMSLSVLRSQISRVLNAAKRDSEGVTKKLNDSKLRWNVLLKALPKVKPTMGAPSQEKTAEQTAIEAETNVGTLVQVIAAAAKRLEVIGRTHTPGTAYYAFYMGKNIREFVEIAQAECLKLIGEHTVAGIIQHDALMVALDLVEEPKVTPAPAAAPAAVAVAA